MTELNLNENNAIEYLFKHTEFQVYRVSPGIVDFTEKKLLLMSKSADTTKKSSDLSMLLQSYRNGDVVVAWRGGKPIFKRVVRDSD